MLFFVFVQCNLAHSQVTLSKTYTEKGHQVVCVAYSPDSRLMATGGFDSQIVVRNSQSGAVVHKLKGLKGFPLSMAFSADSRYLISGGKDARVTVWDLSSGKQLKQFAKHGDDVTSVAVSGDGKVASASKDKTLRVWDISGNLLKELKEHKREVMAVAFSHDGQRIASGSADGTVKEWNVVTGGEIRSIKAHSGWVRTVAFSQNSALIASGGDDGKINIWNSTTGELKNTIIAHGKWLEHLSFSPDGKYIASGGHDNLLVIVNANSGQIVFSSPKQKYYVLSTAFDPAGKYLLSSTLNSTELSVWDVGALGIREMDVQVAAVPKLKPMITWVTHDNQRTDNITFKVNAKVFTDSPISSVDVFLNDTRYASLGEVEANLTAKSALLEQVVFLSEGTNKIRLVAYNDGGEATSETLSVTYTPPEPEPIAPPVATVEPTPVEEEVEEIIPESKPAVELPKEEIAVAPTQKEPEEDTSWKNEIPKAKPNPYRFALIIGNEDYSTYQTGLEKESDVAFAIRDAHAFKEHAHHILGVPNDNIIFLTNARAIEMDDAVRKLNPIIRALGGKAEVYFFYAGHGFPDEKTKEPYLIPVDVSGSNLRFAVSLKELYGMLTEHPSARVAVFLDACFSGGAREQGLVAARAVRVKPREDRLKGNIVVFTASSGNESAHPYKEKQHGIFTYHLLEKLRETAGNITYKDLSDFLSEQVGVRSVMVNNMPQTPQTNVSYDVEEVWQEWRVR